MRRRVTPAAIVLAALACGTVVLAVIVVGSPAGTTTASRTATVTRGVVLSTVSGTGNLAPSRQAELDFPTSGELAAVYVKAGERVVTDQLLARIDDSSAKVDLAQAEADLASAQAAQTAAASATTSPTSSDTATSTGATLATVAAVSTPTPTPAATASPSSGSGSGSGSTQSPAAAAAAVASAELAVTSAQKALTATQLRAPMSGTIAAVNGSVGDTTGPSSSSSSSGSDAASTSFITLAKVHRFKVDVSLSESDVGKLKKGQPATVSVNAVSGLQLAGHVTNVGVLAASSASSSTGSSTSSAVSYPVTVTLDQGSSRAKAGMSVSVDVVTGKATGLTVPTQALSGSTVTIVKNGKRTATRVETGLAGDGSTEILSGVKAGDQVAMTSASATAGASAAQGGAAAGATQQGAGRRFDAGGGLGGAGLGGGAGGPVVRGGPP